MKHENYNEKTFTGYQLNAISPVEDQGPEDHNVPVPVADFHGEQVVNHWLGVLGEAGNGHTERNKTKGHEEAEVTEPSYTTPEGIE